MSPLDLNPLVLTFGIQPFEFVVRQAPQCMLQIGAFFYTIKMELGESCLRPRLQAAESSICTLRAFAITVSNGGCVNAFKKEDTWCGKLTYFRYGIRYSPEIVE